MAPADYIEDANGCWIWQRAKSGKPPRGYMWVGGKYVLAYRVLWERENGPVPEGMELDHLCRTPLCVNPAHLEAVSHRENVLRGTSPAALAAKRDACVHGHAFTEANTFTTRNGERKCRTCRRIRMRKSYRLADPETQLELLAGV